MFDLDKEIHRWCRKSFASRWRRRAQALELADHLYCEIDRLTGNGMCPEEAFAKATSQLGDAKSLGIEYGKNRNWMPTTSGELGSRFSGWQKNGVSDWIRFRHVAAAMTIGAGFFVSLLLQDADVAEWTSDTLAMLCAIAFRFIAASG